MALKKIAQYLLIPALILTGIGIIVMIMGHRESAGLFGAPGLFLLVIALVLYLLDGSLDYVAKKFRQ